ncbi:MAG TPA: hypothetical protein VG733_03300 [Chthoniobacteraceae bacterium]|nr:hypothetical protein [Chthoniobacteraceae bacterium]
MKTKWVLLFALIAVIPIAHAKQPATRAQFAQAMGRVKTGMTAGEVTALLGKPDTVRTERDPFVFDKYDSVGVKIWDYGTAGPHTFPALGSVCFIEGTARDFSGGDGTPPDVTLLNEAQLRNLLQLIDSAGDGTLQLVQAVNALQAAGKEKALAAIGEYLRVESPLCKFARGQDLHVMFLLRLLFDVPADPGFMPPIVETEPPAPPDLKIIPLFPLALVDDVPLNLAFSAGRPLDAAVQLASFRKNGTFRAHPLRPPDNPLPVLEKLEHSPQWIGAGKPGDYNYDFEKKFIASQVLQLINTTFRSEPHEDGFRLTGTFFDQKQWDAIAKKVAGLHIKWDPKKNIYAFAGGSSLPQEKPPVYMRQIWNVRAIGPDSKLIVWRTSSNWIMAKFIYFGHEGVPFAATTVKVCRARHDDKPLMHFDIAAFDGNGSLSSSGGSGADFPAGEALRAEFTTNGKTTTTEPFTP